MNRFTLILLAAVAFLTAVAPLRSQAPVPLTTRQRLQTLKAANEKLLQQQAAALQKLDETLKESQQLRILARRT